MGRVAAPYATRGWIKVQPFTEYLDSLLDYPVWRLGKKTGWQEYRVVEAKIHSNHLVAQLEGIDDRTQAEALQGLEIAVGRDELPEPEADEFYWDDIIGLDVVNRDGVNLGKVSGILETGAHDVLKVSGERERLIPFTEPIVLEVDRSAGCIRVDWGMDY